MIILGTEVEVAEQDGSLSTRDHQDQEHDEQEPKHVVDLVCPEGEPEFRRSSNRIHKKVNKFGAHGQGRYQLYQAHILVIKK